MTSIAPPPEFMPPSPYPMYEGNWTPLRQVQKTQNPYVPIVSRQVWPDKQKFLDVVKQIETYIYQFDNRSQSPYRRILHRGQVQSRLDRNTTFPVQEYWDMEQKIKWPAEYVGHYIGQFNVMPTKRFFEYIMYRMRNPFPGMPAPAFPASSSSTTPPAAPGLSAPLQITTVDDLRGLLERWQERLLRYFQRGFPRGRFSKEFHPDRCGDLSDAAITNVFHDVGMPHVNIALGGSVACREVFAKFWPLLSDEQASSSSTPPRPAAIAPPPEYGPPMVATQVEGNFETGPNQPVRSQMQWPDKQRFVQAVERLEDFMYQFTSSSGSPYHHVVFRCIHTSVLEPSVRFGCHHFIDMDQRMAWALGYAAHYIGKWNVMPTKRFYDYVMYRLQNPFPQMPMPRARPRPVGRPPKKQGGGRVEDYARPCKYRGDEPSPTGMGHCARDYAVGSLHRGKDRRQWIVAADKNGRKYWKRHTARSSAATASRPPIPSYMGMSPMSPASAAGAPPAAAPAPPPPVVHEYWYAFQVVPTAIKFHEPSRTLSVQARLKKQNLVTPANAHDALLAQQILKMWQNPSVHDGKSHDLNFFLDQEFSADRYATTTGISPWKVHSMRNAGTHVELTLVAQNHYLPLKSLKPAQYRSWKRFLQAIMSMEDADDGANQLFKLETTIGRPKKSKTKRKTARTTSVRRRRTTTTTTSRPLKYYPNGRPYKRGLSWRRDHYMHNKSEPYEVDRSSRVTPLWN